MLQKLASSSFHTWPWWWQPSNGNDGLGRFLLSSALIALFLWWVVHRKSRTRRQPPLPPGPFGLPLVGNLPFLDPELHKYFAKLARDYGPILSLRLGMKLGIVVSSPSLAREILKDQDVTFANRDVLAAAKEASYGGSDIAWSPYGPEWRMLRKVCVRELLGNASLDAVYALRRRELRRTVNYLYGRVGSPVNVGEQMFLNLLNVMTSMLWGATVKGEDGAEFRQVVANITGLMGKPNVSDFFPGLARFDLQGIQKQQKGLVARFDRMFDAIIDRRLKMKDDGDDGKESKDFLQLLLKLEHEGVSPAGDAKTPFTMTHVKALLMDMVVGGTDTTSSTTEFAMAEMMKNPEIMRKAHQELDAMVGRNNIVEDSHIHNLPYLYAVMKEALRLHPALPLLVPHCPSQSCVVGGYNIPKGARVFFNVWAIHRDPSIWENPLEFDPERFLDSKFDRHVGNDFNYFPFGSGRRKCAGIAMAERMFMLSLATLVHSFEWKLPEGEEMEMSEKFGIVLKKKTPLVAIPTPRLSDPALYDE
ncbi:flavonoid 3'-monooxygenase CYP75B137-like [Diospyros lotus]|uniref:flavonoid 3'-monooxygenase CYP75B137-like n=1 Tax=Diospyros lotus TaxID=55363 RepID=UPI002251689F|nr:flavonoid 3'-monooxygenase CYP75B137-like [Diospyros lotus]